MYNFDILTRICRISRWLHKLRRPT